MAEKKAAPKKAAPTNRSSAPAEASKKPVDEVVEPTPTSAEAPEPTSGAGASERAATVGLESVGQRIRISPTDWNRRHGGFLTWHYEARDVRLPCDGASALDAVKHFEQYEGGGELDVLDPTKPVAHVGWMSMTTTGLLGVSWEHVPRRPDRITLDPVSDETAKVQQQIDAWTGSSATGSAAS